MKDGLKGLRSNLGTHHGTCHGGTYGSTITSTSTYGSGKSSSHTEHETTFGVPVAAEVDHGSSRESNTSVKTKQL